MEDDSPEPSHAAKPNGSTFSGSSRMTAEIQILPKKSIVGKRFLKDFRLNWLMPREYPKPPCGLSLPPEQCSPAHLLLAHRDVKA